jgi:hypothetical protein
LRLQKTHLSRSPEAQSVVCMHHAGNFVACHALLGMPYTHLSAQAIKAARKRAQQRFKTRMAQKNDAPRAVAEYYATQQAAIDRISGLREQRLERERKAHRRDAR